MLLNDFHPKPALVTRVTEVLEPKFPVFDAHNHLGVVFGGGWDQRPVQELLEVLNAARVRHFVDLDGGWGEDLLQRHLDHFKAADPERFFHYGGVNWSAWPEHGSRFGEYAAARLRRQAAWGAEGLKIWKELGLKVKDQHGQLVPVDDPRLDPLWETAAELALPVTIHVADPVAFFQPVDRHNERWEELQAHPDWRFTSPPFPPFLSIMDGLANLVRRHPRTVFVGAHVGCYAENLAWVSALLDECPNFYVDISARLAELGRQPYSTRRFLIQHADRVLFGADMSANLEMYRIHYRFLETDDEYFPYERLDPPGQGRWAIYGVHLPDDVLEKIYYRNAERLFLARREKFGV